MKRTFYAAPGAGVTTFLFCFFFFFGLLHAEKAKIDKVPDSNLFVLESGQQLRLAYVDAPSTFDTSRALSSLAVQTLSYLKRELLHQTVRIEYLGSPVPPGEPAPVIIYKSYPLKTICYNKLFLEEGRGKFRMETDSSFAAEYRGYEAEARAKGRGIWDEARLMQTRHVGSVIFGHGKYEEFDGAYKEIMAAYEPFSSASGMKIVGELIFTREFPQDVYEENSWETLGWATISYVINRKYIGLEPGVFVVDIGDSELDPTFLHFFMMPRMDVKIGRLDRFYLSLNLLSDLLYAPASVAVVFFVPKPYGRVSVSYSGVLADYKLFSFNSQWKISQKWVVNLHGIKFDRHRGEPGDSYGFRIGAGYIFGGKP